MFRIDTSGSARMSRASVAATKNVRSGSATGSRKDFDAGSSGRTIRRGARAPAVVLVVALTVVAVYSGVAAYSQALPLHESRAFSPGNSSKAVILHRGG